MADEPSEDVVELTDALSRQLAWHHKHDRQFTPEWVSMVKEGGVPGWQEIRIGNDPLDVWVDPPTLIADLTQPMCYEIQVQSPLAMSGYFYGRAVPFTNPEAVGKLRG